MAINIGEVFSDLAYKPSLTQVGDISTVINAKSIKQGILTILYTPRGSRLFEPDFGCSINNYLFEPINGETTGNLRNEIRSAIKRWEPRIQELTVNVQAYEDKQEYVINIKYKLVEINRYDSVTVTLERL